MPDPDFSASDGPAAPRRPGPIAVLRSCVFALTTGLVMTTAMFYLIRGGKPPAGSQALPSLIVAPIVATAAVLLATVVPASTDAAARRRISASFPGPGGLSPAQAEEARSALTMQYQTRTIVRCAVLQGAGMFLAIIYFLNGDPWLFALIAVVAGLVASSFPTEGRVSGWIDDQLGKIEEIRIGG